MLDDTANDAPQCRPTSSRAPYEPNPCIVLFLERLHSSDQGTVTEQVRVERSRTFPRSSDASVTTQEKSPATAAPAPWQVLNDSVSIGLGRPLVFMSASVNP